MKEAMEHIEASLGTAIVTQEKLKVRPLPCL